MEKYRKFKQKKRIYSFLSLMFIIVFVSFFAVIELFLQLFDLFVDSVKFFHF